jgi:hypothetical protein
MLEYLIFSINASGGISTPTTAVSCPDDAQAVAEAKALNLGLMVEIWQGSRQVAVLPATT